MTFTDIRFDLVSCLPERVRPYALMMRLDRPTGWWLLLLPGWWAIALHGMAAGGMSMRHWSLMGLFFVGAIIMRGAGCIINDLWDRDLDKKVERTRVRPLASGQVSVRQASFFLGLLLLLGLFILLQTSPAGIALGLGSMVLVILYPLMKRITWWPQAFLGITFNFGALIGWAALENNVSAAALLLYLAGIFWTLGYDTIYAHQDKEDDVMAGIKSTARLFGARSKIWVGGFYALSWILIVMAALQALPGSYAPHFLIPAAAHFVWQIARWNMEDQTSSLKMFKSNVMAGLLVLCGLFATAL